MLTWLLSSSPRCTVCREDEIVSTVGVVDWLVKYTTDTQSLRESIEKAGLVMEATFTFLDMLST